MHPSERLRRFSTQPISDDTSFCLKMGQHKLIPAMRFLRVRFSLRAMLVLIAVLTVPFAFWGWRLRAAVAIPGRTGRGDDRRHRRLAGLIAGILIRASRGRSCLLGPQGWGLLALNAMVAIWFSSVESTYFVESCPACGHGRDVIESRFFSNTPRRVTREFPSLAELIASDIGIPCDHKAIAGWWHTRLFGGCLWGERFRRDPSPLGSPPVSAMPLGTPFGRGRPMTRSSFATSGNGFSKGKILGI